jgi:hypothetical protein
MVTIGAKPFCQLDKCSTSYKDVITGNLTSPKLDLPLDITLHLLKLTSQT